MDVFHSCDQKVYVCAQSGDYLKDKGLNIAGSREGYTVEKGKSNPRFNELKATIVSSV